MLPDTEKQFREPWQFRKRLLPQRTYSGRVVYDRPLHPLQVGDLARMARALAPPDDVDPNWIAAVIGTIREASLFLLGLILPFLDGFTRRELYDAAIQMMDKVFHQGAYGGENIEGKQLVLRVAQSVGVTIEIKG
jgi:hypothetical protein